MTLNALCIGEKWLPYRRTGADYSFTVHSSFNRVVNFSTGRGLLSVAAEGVGLSPQFLVVPGGNVGRGVRAGDVCPVRAGKMNMAGRIINFENAVVWKGPVSAGCRYGGVKPENIAAFRSVLDRKAPPQSAWRFIGGGCESRFSGLGAIQKLGEDPSLVRRLAGLGPGLTPAGDDMLLGFLAMIDHCDSDSCYVKTLRAGVAAAMKGTTDISAQMLENALNGDYHEFVQNCIRDLCEGGREEVSISAASLLTMGATSGSDIACGMYFAMMKNREEKHCCQKHC